MAAIKAMGDRTRVAIVDDDENTRLCYKDILQTAKNFDVSGSYSCATQALKEIPCLRPDLTLMDIRMPDINGIECTKRLKRAVPDLKIVIVTGSHEQNCISECLEAGVIAYLIKPFIGDQLLATLHFANITQVETTVNLRKAGTAPAQTNRAAINWSLSPREKQVLAGLADGLLYKEISERLGISYAAVHKYQHNVFKKLNVSNRSEAIRIWLGNRS